MNPRLVSAADKTRNCRQRAVRRNSIKRGRRSDATRSEVSPIMTAVLTAAGLISPEEAWTYQKGSGAKVRHASKRARYWSVLYGGDWGGPVLPDTPDAELREVEPPSRTLQARHRGRSLNIFRGPPVGLPDVPAACDNRIRFLVSAAVEQISAGACRFRMVDDLQQKLACGMEAVMAIVNSRENFRPRFTTDDVNAVTQARRYLAHFREARTSYAAMVEAYGIPVARGDWGAYVGEDIEQLRLGLEIPKRLQRGEYLVRFLDVCDGEPTEVHFYSLGYLPLFRLPLRS